MAIDVKSEPGLLMHRLAKELIDRQPRLQSLHDRYRGKPPLPEGTENVLPAYERFQRKSRTNFAELIVEAPRERMTVLGFRTGADDDDNGDKEAKRIFDANGLAVETADVFEDAFVMGDAYIMVGGVDPEIGAPVITGEDPREVITLHDPVRPQRVLAALKLFHDDQRHVDRAYLYKLADEPGDRAEVWVAERHIKRSSTNKRVTWSPSMFSWNFDLCDNLPHSVVPVVRCQNRRGVGEFEHHVDILDRINHMVLSRMVIAAMQAYRQRAIKNAPTHDQAGNEIDWDSVFVADPGAIWVIPGADQIGAAAIELWESGQVDLSPVLASVKDDVRDLAAVTRTPLSYLNPDAVSQSAEGATLMREGLVFKVEDRMARMTEALRDVMYLAFLTEGDAVRADRSKIGVLWAPPERRSLSERADADMKARGTLPWRARCRVIWGMTPDEIDLMSAERAEDLLASAQADLEATRG